MKQQKTLKKLVLNKEKIDTIAREEEKSVKGGLFGSRFICTQTKADVGCTSHTNCNKPVDQVTTSGEIVFLCID